MFMFRRAAAIAAALGLALVVPAAASASTLATKYTKNYAGYYATASFHGGTIVTTVTLPGFTALAKITNSVTSEIRLYSAQGEFDLQLTANPKTATAYKPKFLAKGVPVPCGTATFPPGDTVNEGVQLAGTSNDLGGDAIEWSLYDDAGRSGGCALPWSPTFSPTYSKAAFVGSFNAATFRAPSSRVTLASFTETLLDLYGTSVTRLAEYNHGKLIATSTATRSGTVRATPSAIDSTGTAFSVYFPAH